MTAFTALYSAFVSLCKVLLGRLLKPRTLNLEQPLKKWWQVIRASQADTPSPLLCPSPSPGGCRSSKGHSKNQTASCNTRAPPAIPVGYRNCNPNGIQEASLKYVICSGNSESLTPPPSLALKRSWHS